MRKFDFPFPDELYGFRAERDEKDGGRAWAERLPPLEAAELFQRFRIDLTRLLEKPDLPAETRTLFEGDVRFLVTCLMLLGNELAGIGEPLRPPSPAEAARSPARSPDLLRRMNFPP